MHRRRVEHAKRWIAQLVLCWATLSFPAQALATSAPTKAQTKPSTPSVSAWSLRYGLGSSISLSLGNLQQFNLLAQGKIAVESSVLGLRTGLSYQLGFLGGQLNRNALNVRAGISLWPKSTTSMDVMSIVQTNSLRKIESRFLVGGGGRLFIVQNKHHRVRTGLYAAFLTTQYESEQFAENYGIEGSSLGLFCMRVTLRGEHTLWPKRVFLSYGLFYLTSLHFAYVQVGGSFHTDIALSHRFALRLSTLYTYENILQANTQAHDLLITFGLQVRS